MQAIARTGVGLVLLAILAVATGVVAGPAAADVTGNETVTVTDVVDGDTVDVRYENGSTDTVRLVGIDAPETYGSNRPRYWEGVPSDYFGSRCLDDEGEDASAFLTDQLEGETVTLRFDDQTDRRGDYGRLLAYVYDDGEDYNYKLVHTGHAQVFNYSGFTRVDRYDTAQAAAREVNRDVWRCQNTRTRGQVDIERIAAGANETSLNDEYVVLENTGYRPRSLDGWTVSNGSGATYTFGRQVLLPGETVTLYTGEGTDNRSAVYWGRSSEAWTGNGTVSLTADGGELATTRLYNESGVVRNP